MPLQLACYTKLKFYIHSAIILSPGAYTGPVLRETDELPDILLLFVLEIPILPTLA